MQQDDDFDLDDEELKEAEIISQIRAQAGAWRRLEDKYTRVGEDVADALEHLRRSPGWPIFVKRLEETQIGFVDSALDYKVHPHFRTWCSGVFHGLRIAEFVLSGLIAEATGTQMDAPDLAVERKHLPIPRRTKSVTKRKSLTRTRKRS